MKNYMTILPEVRGESRNFTTKDTQQRSPKAYASLPLLQLLEKVKRAAKQALQVEEVPAALAVVQNKFRLIHSESGLRILSNFTQDETEATLNATQHWANEHWQVDEVACKPACEYLLISLLESSCYQAKQTGGGDCNG